MTAPLVLSFAPQTDPREIIVRAASGQRELFRTRFFCRTGQTLRPATEALFCLGLYPASEVGAALHLEGDIDNDLMLHSDLITDLFRSWWPSCKQVKVLAQPTHCEPAPDVGGTGLFFSGGVDSCFSLVEAQHRLTALITLIGVDVPLSDPAAVARLEAMTTSVAKAKGMTPIIIETDASTRFHPFASWIQHHGSVLAAIGYLLSDHINHVLIASSGDESTWHVPWGSHPALDPMFGSARLTIEHHGLVARYDKIARIVADDILMQNLRVCNRARQNCGFCDKCTFAMRSLDILGAEARATTFPPFEPRRGKLKIVDDAFLSELVRLREAAFSADRNDLLPEIDQTIATYRRHAGWPGLRAGRLRWWQRVMRHRWRWYKASRG